MAISQAEAAHEIEGFIRRQFRILNGNGGLTPNTHLFQSGYVDSVGVIELIAYVESAFGVKLEDEHIFSDLFTTIDGISGLVAGLSR